MKAIGPRYLDTSNSQAARKLRATRHPDSGICRLVPRPTLLIAELEPLQAISARKLVLETAKFNVVTAHSGQETIDLLNKFPAVDGVIVHSELHDLSAAEVFQDVKKADARKPTILLISGVARSRKDADYTVASDEPDTLLQLVRKLFGDPRPYDAETQNLRP